MANKAISELPQAQNVNNQDLFVLEQSGIAKKLTAETFITEQGIIDALAEALDGHGGIQSVTLSSVSGRIRTYLITFTDGTSTTFQVLDGTSIDRIVKTSTAGLTDTYTVFMTDGTTTFFTVTNGADGSVSEAMLNDALKDKAPAVTETTESSAIANFTDGADDLVMHNIVAEIAPVQSGSGDPSPSNIRPINGWTECNVTRAGKNLLSTNGLTLGTPSSTTFSNATKRTFTIGTYVTGLSVGNYYQVKTSSISVSDNNISFTTSATAYGIAIPLVGFPVGEKITISATKTNGNVGFSFYKQNGTYISGDRSAPNKNYYTVVIPTETFYTVAIFDAQSNNVESTFTNIMIEFGDASAYEPYITPATASLSWQDEAGTVYGGTIDVATGLLTVTHAMQLMTGASSEGWNLWSGKFVASISGIARANSTSSNNRIIIADRFKSNGVQYRAQCEDGQIIKVIDSNNYIACYSSVYTDINAFTASLGTNPMTVVYKLATPQTYQLTPQQLMTLLGTNNVWADTGNVSVTYPADTKMFIEKLTMPTEDDLVANQAITSGKYFMIGNSLYLALANIASGAQITIGTNAQRVSLADALNTINS